MSKAEEIKDSDEHRFTAPGISIQLAEKEGKKTAPDSIQLLRKGVFFHEFFGRMEISDKLLDSFVKNFEDRRYGVDIMLDFSHNSFDAAAGWFTGLRKESKGLFADIKWTPKGREAVESGEFRYTSADFTENFKDPETLKEFGPLLFGAALTNRPFIKRMEPVIALSENKLTLGDEAMTPEEKKQLDELTQGQKTLSEKVEGLKTENKQLSEKNTALEAKLAESKKAEAKTAEEKVLAEKNSVFDKMLSENKAVEAQRESYIAGDVAAFAKLAEVPNAKPAGHGKDPVTGQTTDADMTAEQAEDKLVELAEEKAKVDKITLAEATDIVLKENPKLDELRMEKFA